MIADVGRTGVTSPVYHGSGLFRDFVPAFTNTYCGGDPRAPAPPCYGGAHT